MRSTRSTTRQANALLEAVLRLSESDTGNNIISTNQTLDETSSLERLAIDSTSLKNLTVPTIPTPKPKRVTKPRTSIQDQPRRVSNRIAGQSSRKTSSPKTSDIQNIKPISEKISLTTEESKTFSEDKFVANASSAPLQKTRSRTKKDRPASATNVGPHVSGRVQKQESPGKQVRQRTKLIVKLRSIRYKQLDYKTLKGWGLRRPKLEKNYWPYPHYPGFKLGHDPWAHLNWPAPDVDQIRMVHKLLADHHQKFDFGSYVSMPSHATEAKVTIDAIFQTLFAQSTDNEIAIDTHSRLCNAFPYLVDGKKHVGKMPNWHEIRLLERDELPAALQQGGFHEMRAGFVKGILDCVYQKNQERKVSGKQKYEFEGNPPDAIDFVPGMLSMDWLTDTDLDNSDEAILGRLIQLSGIGIKSAMCVMAFSMKRPLFVVDVHVLRYAQWLGWVPKDATNVDWVAMYLHKHIPDDIKYDLHNQIWTHCANENTKESKSRAVICPFCGARPPARNRDVSHHTCPLADLLPPLETRWGKAYTLQLRQEAREAAKTDKVNAENGEKQVNAEDSEFAAVPALRQTSITNFAHGLLTPPSSPVDPSTDLVDATRAENPEETEETVSSVTKTKKVKKLNLKAKSHRFEDVSKEQGEELAAAGYYLWEFRPMDNTFMEEWGTFDKKPRYKWERDTVMDKDVAVTWEYANNVLNNDHSHKWSRRSADGISTDEIMTLMEE